MADLQRMNELLRPVAPPRVLEVEKNTIAPTTDWLASSAA